MRQSSYRLKSKKVLGVEHPDTLIIMGNLVSTHQQTLGLLQGSVAELHRYCSDP